MPEEPRHQTGHEDGRQSLTDGESPGESRLTLTAEAGGPLKLTVITLGEPLRP